MKTTRKEQNEMHCANIYEEMRLRKRRRIERKQIKINKLLKQGEKKRKKDRLERGQVRPK